MANLKIQDISKSVDNLKVLNNINLEIKEGELVSLLGPSGCGKTTLLKIIAGLEHPDNGKIYFNEVDYTNVESNKRNAVIVFQDCGLFPHMTIYQNIEFGLKVRGIIKSERRRRSVEMLELMQLEDKGNNYPFELSGGQKQRVALARALLLLPKVLLLDEPFSNLDTNLKEIMREFVLDLQKKLGFTAILVTHDKEEAFIMSNRVAVIINGKLHQFDTPVEIYNRPRTKELSDFIGEANYLDGEVKDGIFYSTLGEFEVAANDKKQALLMVKYDQIQLLKDKTNIQGKITDRKYAGKVTLYKVSVKDQVILNVNSSNDSFKIDDVVYLNISIGINNIY